MTLLVWDSPAQVRWSPEVTADQIAASGDGVRTRTFPRLKQALDFVMDDLRPTPAMTVGVYPDAGTALINLAEIEQAYRSGPHLTGEPAGAA